MALEKLVVIYRASFRVCGINLWQKRSLVTIFCAFPCFGSALALPNKHFAAILNCCISANSRLPKTAFGFHLELRTQNEERGTTAWYFGEIPDLSSSCIWMVAFALNNRILRLASRTFLDITNSLSLRMFYFDEELVRNI